jgi:hypothetical protein
MPSLGGGSFCLISIPTYERLRTSGSPPGSAGHHARYPAHPFELLYHHLHFLELLHQAAHLGDRATAPLRDPRSPEVSLSYGPRLDPLYELTRHPVVDVHLEENPPDLSQAIPDHRLGEHTPTV